MQADTDLANTGRDVHVAHKEGVRLVENVTHMKYVGSECVDPWVSINVAQCEVPFSTIRVYRRSSPFPHCVPNKGKDANTMLVITNHPFSLSGYVSTHFAEFPDSRVHSTLQIRDNGTWRDVSVEDDGPEGWLQPFCGSVPIDQSSMSFSLPEIVFGDKIEAEHTSGVAFRVRVQCRSGSSELIAETLVEFGVRRSLPRSIAAPEPKPPKPPKPAKQPKERARPREDPPQKRPAKQKRRKKSALMALDGSDDDEAAPRVESRQLHEEVSDEQVDTEESLGGEESAEAPEPMQVSERERELNAMYVEELESAAPPPPPTSLYKAVATDYERMLITEHTSLVSAMDTGQFDIRRVVDANFRLGGARCSPILTTLEHMLRDYTVSVNLVLSESLGDVGYSPEAADVRKVSQWLNTACLLGEKRAAAARNMKHINEVDASEWPGRSRPSYESMKNAYAKQCECTQSAVESAVDVICADAEGCARALRTLARMLASSPSTRDISDRNRSELAMIDAEMVRRCLASSGGGNALLFLVESLPSGQAHAAEVDPHAAAFPLPTLPFNPSIGWETTVPPEGALASAVSVADALERASLELRAESGERWRAVELEPPRACVSTERTISVQIPRCLRNLPSTHILMYAVWRALSAAGPVGSGTLAKLSEPRMRTMIKQMAESARDPFSVIHRPFAEADKESPRIREVMAMWGAELASGEGPSSREVDNAKRQIATLARNKMESAIECMNKTDKFARGMHSLASSFFSRVTLDANSPGFMVWNRQIAVTEDAASGVGERSSRKGGHTSLVKRVYCRASACLEVSKSTEALDALKVVAIECGRNMHLLCQTRKNTDMKKYTLRTYFVPIHSLEDYAGVCDGIAKVASAYEEKGYTWVKKRLDDANKKWGGESQCKERPRASKMKKEDSAPESQ